MFDELWVITGARRNFFLEKVDSWKYCQYECFIIFSHFHFSPQCLIVHDFTSILYFINSLTLIRRKDGSVLQSGQKRCKEASKSLLQLWFFKRHVANCTYQWKHVLRVTKGRGKRGRGLGGRCNVIGFEIGNRRSDRCGNGKATDEDSARVNAEIRIYQIC